MILLAILGPAFISVMIRYKQKKYSELHEVIIEYGVYALVITLFTQSFITYVLRMSGVTQDALESFPFFTKYVVFAIIFAAILPVIQALIAKYIKVSIEVGVYDEEKESEEEKNS